MKVGLRIGEYDCFGLESRIDLGLGRRMRGGFIYSHLTARMTTQLKRVYGTVAVVRLPFAGGVGISFPFNATGAELRARRCLLQREYEAESRCKQEVR
jgi:hypothetical protein